MTETPPTYFRRGLGLKAEVVPVLESEYGSALVGLIRENDYRFGTGRLRLRLAQSFGFCYGVDRAVEYAYQTRTKFPDRAIYLIGEIIHNPFVNRQLSDRGIQFLYAEADGKFDLSSITPDEKFDNVPCIARPTASPAVPRIATSEVVSIPKIPSTEMITAVSNVK